MTWPLAILLGSLGLLALVALIWIVAVIVVDADEDEPYEYQPLYLVTREDR